MAVQLSMWACSEKQEKKDQSRKLADGLQIAPSQPSGRARAGGSASAVHWTKSRCQYGYFVVIISVIRL